MRDAAPQSRNTKTGLELERSLTKCVMRTPPVEVIESRGWSDIPLLCIDPWSGDLGMLLFRDDWEKKLTPGELVDGRSAQPAQRTGQGLDS